MQKYNRIINEYVKTLKPKITYSHDPKGRGMYPYLIGARIKNFTLK